MGSELTKVGNNSVSKDITEITSYESLVPGNHTVKFKATATGYNDSSATSLSFNKLAPVSQETITNDLYTFQLVGDASSYDIYAINGSIVIYLGNETKYKVVQDGSVLTIYRALVEQSSGTLTIV